MKLVWLVGAGAVGKMTVGRQLAQLTGLRLFHNHASIELVIDVFGYLDKRQASASARWCLKSLPRQAMPG